MPRNENETIYQYLSRWNSEIVQIMDDVRWAEKTWTTLNLTNAQKTAIKNDVNDKLTNIQNEVDLIKSEISSLQ